MPADHPSIEVVDDVRGDVAAAFASLKEPEPAVTPADGSEGGSPEPDAQTQAQGDRPRDEHGRFAAKTVEQPTAPEPKLTDADPPPANVVQPSPADEAPRGWSADAKAKWSSLDASIRAEVQRRETQTDEAGQRWSQEKRAYDELVAPLEAASRKQGVSARDGLRNLLAAHDYLDRDAPTAIRYLAQRYRVDLAELAKAAPAPQPSSTPQPSPSLDPRIVEQVVDQRLSNWEAHRATEADIATFAQGKEHFGAVKQAMGMAMLTAGQMGQTLDLQTAYDQACWANPEIRAKLMTAQTGQADRQKSERDAAERARRGSISLNGGPSGRVTPPARTYDTVEEAARAAYAEVASRAH